MNKIKDFESFVNESNESDFLIDGEYVGSVGTAGVLIYETNKLYSVKTAPMSSCFEGRFVVRDGGIYLIKGTMTTCGQKRIVDAEDKEKGIPFASL